MTKKLLILIFFLFILLVSSPAWGGSALQVALPKVDKVKPVRASGQPGKIVMVIVDRLSLTDLASHSLPNFTKIIENGAVGLMNCNTAGGRSPENTYATIGAGSHLLASGTAPLGFNARERLEKGLAAEEYLRRTGKVAPPESVIHLGIARIHHKNASLEHPALPGALGTQLHQASLKTAVIGNADTPSGLKRQAITIAMDNNGLVDYGNVGPNLLIKDPAFPNGLRTNYEKLLSEINRLPKDVSFIVTETGDLSRLEEAKDDVFDSIMQKQRQQTLRRIDNLLGQILNLLDLNRDLLLLVSPTPAGKVDKQENYFSIIMATGTGISKGLLISPSTKRQGIVLNTDIAPTILHFLNLPVPNYMSGRPLQVAGAGNQLTTLSAMNKQLSLTYIARTPVQKGYIIYQLILLFVSLYAIFWCRNDFIRILQPFLLSVMSVPLVYLLVTLLKQPSLTVLVVEVILLTIIVTTIALAIESYQRLGSFIFLCIANAGLILADTLWGGSLQKTALMSYDPIGGARFYGIGNEYMGVLIGSIIIGCTALFTILSRHRTSLLIGTGILFGATIYILGAPHLGTNMGGAIASTAALLTTFLLLAEIRFNVRTIFVVAASVVALVIGFAIFDLLRPPELQSHFGRSANLVLAGGYPEVINIITRKAEVNLRLIKYTIWSRIFLASLGSLALLFYQPVGVMATIRKKYPYLFRGFIGVVVGSITAFTFNDSGIVAAATAMIFGAPPLIYMILQEQGRN